ncbi:MAG: 3-deoxy-D-manno-octulosonic acid transferase [Deltaproteobacteria bacterium]|nr:3-deoxy-D-manno-octulosonic acid transferase [Deltaproteobacteria bacterium]
MFYLLYRVLSVVLLSILFFPFMIFILVTGKYRKHLSERFGFIPSQNIEKFIAGPRIWIHAVSLGEIKVADSIINSLKKMMPGCSILLSTTTEHGRKQAIELLGDRVSIIYAPVDFFLCVKKALHHVNPDVIIFLETEIWPSWIIEANRAGIRVVLLNGRISARSFKRYLLLRPFLKGILSCFSRLSMISDMDKERIISMGADPDKTVVSGNAKYDLLIDQTTPDMNEHIRNAFNIGSDAPVIIAGSTRTGEEDILLKAFHKIVEQFRDTVLIIAPRHIERVKDITALLQKNREVYHLKSELAQTGIERKNNIIIIDSYGELFNIYSAGSIAFCGASLAPLGGQNPLEPAAWGVPVFHGPHMDDFFDAKDLLKKYDAAVEVTGPDDFAEKAVYLLNNPDLLKQKGLNAKKALIESLDSAKRHACVVKDVLKG